MNGTPRSIPTIVPRQRAFTLVEIMLAVVLGSLVLMTAFGVFYALQRSARQSEDRLHSAMQLSQTQRAVELALRTMILSKSRPPTPATPLPTDRVNPPGTPPVADATPPPEDTPFERPRVILSQDDSQPPMHWIDSQGRDIQVQPQRLEITIERPPVFPAPRPGENFVPVVNRMYASRHQRDRERRRQQRDAQRDNASSGDQQANPADDQTDDTEPAIAAGVRGAFGLIWEPDHPRQGDAPKPDGGSWSLWWRTLPPVVSSPETDTAEGLTDSDIDNNPMYRPVLLASNLRWCKWEAVRAGETLSDFTSTWWEDLPAYVTLEIQTDSGKWSKWMFEVQGTRGDEPGTVLGGAPPGSDAQSAAAAALNAVTGQQSGTTRPRTGTLGRGGGK